MKTRRLFTGFVLIGGVRVAVACGGDNGDSGGSSGGDEGGPNRTGGTDITAGTDGGAGSDGAHDAGPSVQDGGEGESVREVKNVEDAFTYGNVVERYSNSESYRWLITTGMAVLTFQSVEITSGDVTLTVSNPSTVPPLYEATFAGAEQVLPQHLGPATENQWTIDLEYNQANGHLAFSLAAEATR